MPDVKFACPGCQLHIKVGVEHAGTATACPECRQPFKIPAPPGEIKFACGGCQLRIALHESYIGSPIACPGCNANVVVPNPSAPAPAKPKLATRAPTFSSAQAQAPAKPQFVSVGTPPPSRPVASAGNGEPAGSRAKAVGPTTRPPNAGAPPSFSPPVSAGATCPECAATMEIDAIICTACGYNRETGEAMPSVEATPPPPPEQKRRKRKPVPVAASAEDVRMRDAYIKQERSLKSAATLFFAGGLFYLLIGGVFLFVELKPPKQGTKMVGLLFGGFGFVICLIGWGARMLRPWARTPFIIFNLINLLSFPIGTLISAICINHSVGDKGRYLFSPEYSEIIRRTPQVKPKTSIWGWLFLAVVTLMIAGIIWGVMQTD